MEEYFLKLPAKPGSKLYEVAVVMRPDEKDGFYIEVQINERTFWAKDLLKITDNHYYGIGKNVFWTLEEAEAMAQKIRENDIRITHVKWM